MSDEIEARRRRMTSSTIVVSSVEQLSQISIPDPFVMRCTTVNARVPRRSTAQVATEIVRMENAVFNAVRDTKPLGFAGIIFDKMEVDNAADWRIENVVFSNHFTTFAHRDVRSLNHDVPILNPGMTLLAPNGGELPRLDLVNLFLAQRDRIFAWYQVLIVYATYIGNDPKGGVLLAEMFGRKTDAIGCRCCGLLAEASPP